MKPRTRLSMKLLRKLAVKYGEKNEYLHAESFLDFVEDATRYTTKSGLSAERKGRTKAN